MAAKESFFVVKHLPEITSAGYTQESAFTKLPRLLLIANFLSANGGSRSVMEDLADRLQASVDQITCASHYRSGLLRGLHMAAIALIKRRDYDLAVVDLYSGRAFLWGETIASLLKLLRCPFVFVLRGGGLPDFAKRHPQRVRECLSKANIVTVPSPFLLEQMRPYLDEPVLLPNPLDIARYEFKKRITTRPNLIWLRSLHETYNPSLAVEVLAGLLPEFPEARLTIIGPDKGDGSWQRVEQLAGKLGVTNQLEMPGGVAKKDVPQWLNRGDIFLNTTNVDNTPVSVLEAMASGLCVVTTNVGGVPYLMEHEKDALLVPPNNIQAMTDAVRRVLTETVLAEKLSVSGRQKAEQFDWSAIMPEWEKVFRSINTKKP